MNEEYTQVSAREMERAPEGMNASRIEAEESDFDYSGYQLVRREFFAHTQEPSIVFNQGKVGVNTACIRRLPDTEYIQILVNREQKKLVIKPCEESDIHSFQWCTSRKGRKQPRQVTGKLFFLKVCALMEWNPDYRYKIMGKLVHSEDEYLFVFDLSATETYQRMPKEGSKKPRLSRTPVFPLEWKDQFGIPYEDRHKVLQVNTFDGFAVYAIGSKPEDAQQAKGLPEAAEAPAHDEYRKGESTYGRPDVAAEPHD